MGKRYLVLELEDYLSDAGVKDIETTVHQYFNESGLCPPLIKKILCLEPNKLGELRITRSGPKLPTTAAISIYTDEPTLAMRQLVEQLAKVYGPSVGDLKVKLLSGSTLAIRFKEHGDQKQTPRSKAKPQQRGGRNASKAKSRSKR
jgi:hypothetical protein